MSKFRKFSAVLLSAIMLVCTLCVSAGAESVYNKAKTIQSGKKYSAQLTLNSRTADYKITSTGSGTLKINVNVKLSHFGLYVFDSNGNKLEPTKRSSSTGKFIRENGIEQYSWDNYSTKYVGTITYSVKKGSYYIRVERLPLEYVSGNGKVTLKATLTTSGSTLKGIAIPMRVGSSLQLSAVASGSTSGVKWSSSNSSVASVSSSGKVTAKKKGTATITAKLGSQKHYILIKVS